MKLDRTTNPDRLGKYDLILNRRLAEIRTAGGPTMEAVEAALGTLRAAGVLDESVVGNPGEFFVIRLRDKYAGDALAAYAVAALIDDPEYATEIVDMQRRAGRQSPFCKRPD